MKWTQVQELHEAGWEILCHTQTHPNLTELDEAGIRAEFEGALKYFKDNGIDYVINHVYPYLGNNKLVRRIAQEYYESARGTLAALNPEDLNLYSLSGYCGGDSTLEDLKSIVDDAKVKGRWAIIYYHEIDEAKRDEISDLIDYIKAENIPIVATAKALELIYL